jgi:3-oxoacyl-[acyl-carrier-protein] synthase III
MKTIISGLEIKSIATCLPKGILEMSSLKEKFGDKEVDMAIKVAGIERLHFTEAGETASDLCFQAAELILENESVDRSTIDGLVFVSEHPDFHGPATSCVLQGRLGLSKNCVCFDINYGCSGYIYGLFQAATLIGSGACNKVLVLAGNTNSKTVDKDRKSSYMVFGDAGSATLVEKGIGTMGFHIMTNGYDYKTVMNPKRGFRYYPENLDKDFKLDGSEMQGDDVFAFIISVGPKSIKEVLELVGWDKDEVDFYGLHQATKVTIDFMCKKLKLAHPERAPFDIANYGNTSSTTVPLLLTDWPYREKGVDTSKWKKVILSAYGIGLSWGSIACDLSETKIYSPINL